MSGYGAPRCQEGGGCFPSGVCAIMHTYRLCVNTGMYACTHSCMRTCAPIRTHETSTCLKRANPYQDSAIPMAFLHLKMRCKNLKNMDGLLGKSDPFFTISRIDGPGSLDEKIVKLYTSPVSTRSPQRALARVTSARVYLYRHACSTRVCALVCA